MISSLNAFKFFTIDKFCHEMTKKKIHFIPKLSFMFDWRFNFYSKLSISDRKD